MCVKVIASQRWDVFWDTVYISCRVAWRAAWCLSSVVNIVCESQRGVIESRLACKNVVGSSKMKGAAPVSSINNHTSCIIQPTAS